MEGLPRSLLNQKQDETGRNEAHIEYGGQGVNDESAPLSDCIEQLLELRELVGVGVGPHTCSHMTVT